LVEKVINGTAPLSGTFKLSLDTRNHPIINIQKLLTTGSISHNAFATAVETGGDGSSVQEKLQALDNIGSVSVARSSVNTKNGGYTWTITFLRDKDVAGGQWGNHCQQKDTYYNLCNSPGPVPKLGFVGTRLGGNCLSAYYSDNLEDYNCVRGVVLDGNNASTTRPPGSKEIQRIFIDNPDYDTSMKYERFNITIDGYSTNCMSVYASASVVQQYINDNITTLSPVRRHRGVYVTSGTDTVNARNGKVFTVHFFTEGDLPLMTVNKCPLASGATDGISWTVASETVNNGELYFMDAADAGVQKGVVQRGKFTVMYVSDDPPAAADLDWNAPAEGYNEYTNKSVKWQLETYGSHKVTVTRYIIGKYGVVEYIVRFVSNPGQIPPGAGDIVPIVAEQAAATDGVVYPVSEFELVKGSSGIKGVYNIDLHSPYGSRVVAFNETAERLKKKLEEMPTVGDVWVTQSAYPSATSGGFGAVEVADGTIGGYEYQIFFLKNPGTTAGFSFPPGSGNVDPLTISYDKSVVEGNGVTITTVNYIDGSTPIDGTFTITFGEHTTDPVSYDQQPEELKDLLEALPNVGTVTTDTRYRMMQRVQGVYVTASRDSNVLTVSYNSSYSVCGNPDRCPIDIRQLLAPGDLIRIGGYEESSDLGQASIDGASFLSLVEAVPESPVLLPLVNSSSIYARDVLRIGDQNYTVVKNWGRRSGNFSRLWIRIINKSLWQLLHNILQPRQSGTDEVSVAAVKWGHDVCLHSNDLLRRAYQRQCRRCACYSIDE